MADAAPQPELLRALGRLARGLSAVFWGLPLALLVCAQALQIEWLRRLGIVPPVAAAGLLLYGVWLMGAFHPRERVWMVSLNRTRLLALVNLGLSPFLYWWSQVPANPYFVFAAAAFAAAGVCFLASLNHTLERLGAMLPDETLRAETRQFAPLNRWLLAGLLGFGALVFAAEQAQFHDSLPGRLAELAVRFHRGIFVALLLLPVAMTMALVWKTKEVILESVFGGHR